MYVIRRKVNEMASDDGIAFFRNLLCPKLHDGF